MKLCWTLLCCLVQCCRWQLKRLYSDCQDDATGTTTNSNTKRTPAKPQIVWTLQDASQLPTALALLQALYNVKSIPDIMAELASEDQLQAAVLADMLDLPIMCAAAVQQLQDNYNSPNKLLPAAVVDSFLEFEALPTCLVLLLPHVAAAVLSAANQQSQLLRLLLSVLGDLEEVWEDAALQEALLGLPCQALVLLLSCNALKVMSHHSGTHKPPSMQGLQLYADLDTMVLCSLQSVLHLLHPRVQACATANAEQASGLLNTSMLRGAAQSLPYRWLQKIQCFIQPRHTMTG